jgi:MraZ protein
VFYGTFHHAIDAKGRTSLPVRFRDALAAAGEPKVFLIQAPGLKALRALPHSEWKKLEERVLQASPFDLKVQKNILRFVSSAQEIDLDVHGRVLVPAPLRAYAALQKDVVWTGMGRDMCLWDKGLFEQQVAEEMAPEDVIDFFKGV